VVQGFTDAVLEVVVVDLLELALAEVFEEVVVFTGLVEEVDELLLFEDEVFGDFEEDVEEMLDFVWDFETIPLDSE
jgi:hypothetical protein